VSNRRCGDGAPWCARADEMFNAPGLHVIDVHHDAGGQLVVTVETDEVVTGCRACGVVATGHGRRVHRAHDAPTFGTSVVIRWRKRVWRCLDPGCPVTTFSESHDLIGSRTALRNLGPPVDLRIQGQCGPGPQWVTVVVTGRLTARAGTAWSYADLRTGPVRDGRVGAMGAQSSRGVGWSMRCGLSPRPH